MAENSSITSENEEREAGQIAVRKAYFSAKELAAHYGVGVSKIWRWDVSGALPPSVNIGGRRLFRISDHVKVGDTT